MDPCKSKAFALLLAVFLGGTISGVVGMRVYNQQIASAGSGRPGIDLDAQPKMVATHLRQELNLSEDQVIKVEDILDDCIMREADLLMQTKQLKTEARSRILELLNGEQRKKFETVLQEVSNP